MVVSESGILLAVCVLAMIVLSCGINPVVVVVLQVPRLEQWLPTPAEEGTRLLSPCRMAEVPILPLWFFGSLCCLLRVCCLMSCWSGCARAGKCFISMASGRLMLELNDWMN